MEDHILLFYRKRMCADVFFCTTSVCYSYIWRITNILIPNEFFPGFCRNIKDSVIKLYKEFLLLFTYNNLMVKLSLSFDLWRNKYRILLYYFFLFICLLKNMFYAFLKMAWEKYLPTETKVAFSPEFPFYVSIRPF